MIIGGCIDHFQPKSHFPHLAYEWDNYRLADPEINQFKGNKTGIIDPFVVELGWFVMDLPSCLLKPGKNISQSIHDNIIYTIEELRLNSHDTLVRIREKIILNYIDQNISIEFLSENYPYIFAELNRQNALDIDYLKTIFIRY